MFTNNMYYTDELDLNTEDDESTSKIKFLAKNDKE